MVLQFHILGSVVLRELEMVQTMELQLMVLVERLVVRQLVLGMEMDIPLLQFMVLGRMV